ncbi:helix-turn-helix transcriptional regulator [Falsiroseomonas oryzae]|uniref:helix-turn-helix transcriptional regulator n=1 Tax=Falsiroseomonas oryzae TaxID=2766473 RepID=UPI0022EA651B|nr:helix-turn-helix transcriptional regulator [Roseomonas sp. MO-31]
MDPQEVALDPASDALVAVRACLADLAEGLGCRAAFLLVRAGTDCSILAAHGLSDEAAAPYTAHWHRLDPWLAALQGPFGGRALRGDDLVAPRLLRASCFHSGWLQPNGFGAAGIAEIVEVRGTTALLYVLRPAEARGFCRQDMLVLRAVAGALGLVIRRSDLSTAAMAAAQVLGGAPTPVLLLLPDGTVLWSNAAAASLWTEGGPLRRQGRRVADRTGDPRSPFARALAAASVPGARPHVVGLPSDGAPVPARLQPLTLRSGRTAVLMAAATPNATVVTPDTVAAALGLTRAQAEVAVLLCRGMETSAISKRIGISQHTLNGHLRDLYFRLRAANRVQAVVRLLGASAAMGVFSSDSAPHAPIEGQAPG